MRTEPVTSAASASNDQLKLNISALFLVVPSLSQRRNVHGRSAGVTMSISVIDAEKSRELFSDTIPCSLRSSCIGCKESSYRLPEWMALQRRVDQHVRVESIHHVPSSALVAPGSYFAAPTLAREALASLSYNQMVVDHELSDAEVDRLFRALADATRRDIVRRTLSAPASVSELATSYDMSFAAVQKHVAVLEVAGLVTKEAHGRERRVHGNQEMIGRAQDLLDAYAQIWRGRVDRLDALLAERDPSTETIDGD